jgi:Domain of unknown function (DUF4126)
MDAVFATVVGIGLAASCGFRVFVPMLVVSAAANGGYLELNQGFAWLGTPGALVAFAIAAAVECGAYYIPWLDHLLDTIASPAAVVAGVILFAASAVSLDPFMQWSLAIIAGGGSAAVVQGGTILTRVASTATTGGLANFVVTTLETLAGFIFPVLFIVVPLVTLALLIVVVACMYYAGREIARRLFARPDNHRV